MISIQHASKKIGEEWVLKDICLELDENKIYGFQGRNGSGKTMLFRAITGLIHLTKGNIYIYNERIQANHMPPSCGLLLEHPAFLKDLTGYQNLKMQGLLLPGLGEEEITSLLAEVGLQDAARKKFGKYSLGMKQRLGIAGALLGHPKLLILDEPTIALDESGVKLLKKILLARKKEGATILVSSHEQEIIDYLSDEVIFMREGTVVSREALLTEQA